MIDERLAIPDAILQRVKQFHAEHAEVEAMLQYLRAEKIQAGRARLALACAGVMTLGDAKRAVHASDAYADGRAERERFAREAYQVFGKLDRTDRELAA